MAGITGKDAVLSGYAEQLLAEAPKGRSLTQDALRRLMANKAALVSIFVIIAIVVLAFFGPYFVPWAYDKIDYAGFRKPPDFAKGHYFGTDQNGRDMLARTLQGTQMSLIVAAVATCVSVLIGVVYGAIAGYFGGRIDAVMMRFVDVLEELGLGEKDEMIRLPSTVREREVLRGGPVQRGRGFVLHTPDYFREGNSYEVSDEICLTATLDILKAMAFTREPAEAVFALGYCGWAAGQLENEIALNGWLTVPFSRDLLFGSALADRYDMALSQLGITRATLSGAAGHA